MTTLPQAAPAGAAVTAEATTLSPPRTSLRLGRRSPVADGLTLRPSNVPKQFLATLAAVTALGPLSLDLYLPGLPRLRADLGVSAQAAQFTVTACIVGLALGQLIAGALSDSLGRRGPLLVGMVAWSATTILCAATPNVQILTGLRLVQGLSAGMGVAVARAVINDLDPQNLIKHLARMLLILAVVPVLAPTFGGLLLQVIGWRGLFVLLACVGAVLTLVVFRSLAESLPADARSQERIRSTLAGCGRLALTRPFILPALISGSAFGVMFTYISNSPFVLQDTYGLSATEYGVVFGVNAAGLILGMQASSRIVARLGARRAQLRVMTGGTIAAVALLVLVEVFPTRLIAFAIPLFFVIMAAGLTIPMSSGAAIGPGKGSSGSTSGLLGCVQFTLGGVLGALSTVVGSGHGADSVAIIATASLALGLCLSLLSTESAR